MISLDEWLPAAGLTLEPNALRAVKEREHCVALTAGPGAGKTEMLAQRADFLLRTGTCRFPKRILAISFKVDAAKNLKERVQHRCGQQLGSRFDSYTFHAFAKRIIDRFRPILIGDDALDAGYKIGPQRYSRTQIQFDDLVPLAIQILEDSQIARNAIRQTYGDVFLDEFQDCTNLQYKLVKISFQGTAIRLIAVGDTKQKIMGWAGALDGIFETFVEDFSAVSLNLFLNFRSKPRLLRMQNNIIRVLSPASVIPDEQFTADGGDIFAYSFEDSCQEAVYLTNLIADWIRIEQVSCSDIAVLVPKQLNLYADHLMKELENRGIPFRNEQQMQDISVEPAARLIVDYLSCLYGKRKPKAWIRLMKQLIPFADDEAQFSVMQGFQSVFKTESKKANPINNSVEPNSGWWEYVCAFLKKVGIETLVALSPDYQSHTRLKEIVEATKACIENLLKIESDLQQALERFSDDQAVRVLTIHKSKGLEFDSVIILGVENETFWGKEDEERCAFFVAVSRAKRRLVLTYSKMRETPAGFKKRWNTERSAHQEFLNFIPSD